MIHFSYYTKLNVLIRTVCCSSSTLEENHNYVKDLHEKKKINHMKLNLV